MDGNQGNLPSILRVGKIGFPNPNNGRLIVVDVFHFELELFGLHDRIHGVGGTRVHNRVLVREDKSSRDAGDNGSRDYMHRSSRVDVFVATFHQFMRNESN